LEDQQPTAGKQEVVFQERLVLINKATDLRERTYWRNYYYICQL